jgi:hypothetical protein
MTMAEDCSSGFDDGGKGNGNRNKKKTREVADLGLIDTKQVRKAYRRQAQLWHPDKVTKTTSTGRGGDDRSSNRAAAPPPGGNGTVISTEESNARFRKIAEAFEVLSDPEKRRDYDSLLEYCRNQRQPAPTSGAGGVGGGRAGADSLQDRFSDLVNNLRDPLRVFEDFFFGGGEVDDDDDDYYSNNPFSHLEYRHRTYQQQLREQQAAEKRQQHRHQQRPYPQEEPVRVFQHREDLYDPMTGDGVVRVSQTEEFAPDDDDATPPTSSFQRLYQYFGGSGERFYYRIIAQDFKKRYDPYTTGLSFVPITDPYLQEEGYRTISSAPGPKQQQHSEQRSSTASTTTSKASIMDSILHPWEVLIPNSDSRVLKSPNGRYVAGLSPNCELMVMLDVEDKVVWNSQTNAGGVGSGATILNGRCFAMLKGSHLVVAVGHPHGGRNPILWYSENLVGDEGDSYYDYEDEFGFWHRRQHSYLAQLDDDGSLAVYSVWSVPSDDGGGLGRRKNLATKAWKTARDWMNGRIRAPGHAYDHLYYQHHFQPQSPPNDHRRHRAASTSSASPPVLYKRCVYSTSRMGCFRLGRRLAQLSSEVHFLVSGILAELDAMYEEGDILSSLKESLWKNGQALRRKMATSSARFVRKVWGVLDNFTDKHFS